MIVAIEHSDDTHTVLFSVNDIQKTDSGVVAYFKHARGVDYEQQVHNIDGELEYAIEESPKNVADMEAIVGDWIADPMASVYVGVNEHFISTVRAIENVADEPDIDLEDVVFDGDLELLRIEVE